MAEKSSARAILAANLKRLRNAAGLTQETLAEQVDCDLSTIGKIESGKRFPSAELLDRLANAFGLPLFELFKEDGAAIAWTRNNAEVRDQLTREIGAAIDSVLKGEGGQGP